MITNVSAPPSGGKGNVTITAMAYDDLTGSSTIASAYWWKGALGDDPGCPSTMNLMDASDGSFDEVAENLTADVPAVRFSAP